MKVTIKDIAEQAGVSIATVSHVINATRYVSPELVEKVERIIKENNYKKDMAYNIRTGKRSQIAFVVPHVEDYVLLADTLSRFLSDVGFTLSIFTTNDDVNFEHFLLTTLLSNKSIGGIILVPAADNSSYYEMILCRTTPFVLAGRFFANNRIDSVTSDHESAVCKVAAYLIKCGHKKIALITGKKDFSTAREQLEGYRRALSVHGMLCRPELVLAIDNDQGLMIQQSIYNFYRRERPTALILGECTITPQVLRFLVDQGVEYPKHISIIVFANKEWTALADPPITVIEEDVEAIASAVVSKIIAKIAGKKAIPENHRIQANFLLRKSTQMIGHGPFGEEAIPIEKLTLSEQEIEELRDGHFKVGISFHYGETAWKRLHENGIRDTLEKYGVRILSVTEAHFDPNLQVTQLEGIRMQKPDAIIAIPSDDIVTAAKFKELAKETKLIFMSSIPTGMKPEEYASCVSVNERENGYNAGVLLGEYFKNCDSASVGFISHGAPFYGTHLRDGIAEQVIREEYPTIKIVSVKNFYKIERAYDVCKEMLSEHPEVEGLYISWDVPALRAIQALKELGREDIAIFTFDLDQEIAMYLARDSMVKGLVTQRPYTQGTAVALATVKALLGKKGYKYIGISPYVVQKNNLFKAWDDIIHSSMPSKLENALLENFT